MAHPEEGADVLAISEDAEMAHLYRTHHVYLLDAARFHVGDEEAADIVSAALVKCLVQRGDVFRRLKGLREKRMALYVAVTDCARDHLRRRKVESKVMQLITGPRAAVRRWMAPHRRVEDREIDAHVSRAMESLRPSWREAFFLVRRQGMSCERAAEVMGVAPATLRAHVVRANEAVKQMLTAAGLDMPPALQDRRSR